MYENLMEAAVEPENARKALRAVIRNQGAPGNDGMTTRELNGHLRRHWGIIRERLLAGKYNPSPVRRAEIKKPDGGTRVLGIPNVQDRFVEQLLVQVMTPIFDPGFSPSSYGYRPGKSAHDAVKQAQKYAQEGRTWVVDIDFEKFFDHIHHDILMTRIGRTIRDKRVLRLIGKYLRHGVLMEGVVIRSEEGTPQGDRCPLCWPTSTSTPWIRNWRSAGTCSADTLTTVTFTSVAKVPPGMRWKSCPSGSKSICDWT